MKMYIFICTRVQRKNKLTFSNVKTLFALLETHKEKRQCHMSVNLKKTEFAPAVVQAGSSSYTFHPEATGAGGKVQSKKLYRLKRELLHSHHVFLKKSRKPQIRCCLITFNYSLIKMWFIIF